MSRERRLEVMGKFADVSATPESADAAADRKRRAVAGIASTIRREANATETRRRRARIAGAFAVAATIALAAGASWKLGASRTTTIATAPPPPARLAGVTGGVILVHEGHSAAVADKTIPLASDDEVTTAPDAHARVLLESGATVEVAEGTRLRLEPGAKRAERVRIGVGEIVVRVPKLGPGESFGVETPDAEVTVHGTSFVVGVREGKTRVVVNEGVVSVKNVSGETFLHAGDAWPSVSATPSAVLPPTAPPVASGASMSRTPSKRELSTLAEQNKLLQQALDARRRGDDTRAIESLDGLLTRYPSSPLTQEARVEKFRALEARGNHARAVVEAQRYLADYPAGFAVNEAKALISR